MPLDFSQFQAVLLDLDGTIYHEDHVLPGAVELVARLRRENRNFACLTNSTTSASRLVQRLGRMGIQIGEDRVYTAGRAAADHILATYGQTAKVFNLATEGIAEMLDGKAQWVEGANDPCDAVIAGTITNVYATEERARRALTLLRNGADLIGCCADRVYPSPRGIEFGSGAYCAMLGYAANVTPFFCGKPQPVFFCQICAILGVKPQDCILIGDNLESDIAGGKALGMQTILALTGVTTEAHLLNLGAARRPDAIVQNLTEV